MSSQQTNAVATKNDVRALIEGEKFRMEVAKVLPKHCTPERMARVALTAVMKTPSLLNCTPASVLNSLMLCSQAGLEPDGRLAHLIPYGTTCQVIFDWKGLVTLAIRNGYDQVYADKVCEGDDFEAGVEDGKKKLTHIINWRQPRGEAYAFYAVCLRNGVMDFEVMTKAEVDAIRERSRAGKSGPWVSDYDEMGKKCPIRRMSKRWDLMPEIRDVINADDDTPPGLGEPKISAPLFSSKEAATPVVESPPAEAIESEAAQPLPSTVIKALRARLAKAKVSEKDLIAFLEGIGFCGETASLEGLHAENDAALGMLTAQLDDLITKIKEAK